MAASPLLREPTQCPKEGVIYNDNTTVPLGIPKMWLFLGSHYANLDYLYSSGIVRSPVVDEHGDEHKKAPPSSSSNVVHVSYPVRLKKSAGFMRVWGLQDRMWIGDQTIVTVVKVGEGTATGTGNGNGNDVDVDGLALAHDMVGVLIPIFDEYSVPVWLLKESRLRHTTARHVEWLGWTEAPFSGPDDTVTVFAPAPLEKCEPPSVRCPILQSNVDIMVKAALLVHGEEFAVEWLRTTQWWQSKIPSHSHDHDDDKYESSQDVYEYCTSSIVYFLNDREQSRRPFYKLPEAWTIDRILSKVTVTTSSSDNSKGGSGNLLQSRYHHEEYGIFHQQCLLRSRDSPDLSSTYVGLRLQPPSLGSCVVGPRKAANFLFGFGSIIQTASRRSSGGGDGGGVDAAPCRIRAEWGYVREWNFQATTAQICALGLRKICGDEKGATINGVVFPAPANLSEFDRRENGYRRIEIPLDFVRILSWHQLPVGARVYAYVPYAPAVVAKYGVDDATGLPVCSGPNPPPGLDPDTESPGLGLRPPSVSHPILQTYIDVVVTGCLEHGTDFAREFIRTTFLWSPYWLNERTLSRRPWVHQHQYVQIDKLLIEELGEELFQCRKLESEYASLF